MRKFKNIIKKSCLLACLFGMSGCNSWLDIKPVGVQTSDTYWQTKEEAEQVLLSAYVQLRECMPYFFRWGELRGNELAYGTPQSSDNSSMAQAERDLRRMEILPSGALSNWSPVYVAIGRCNTVIKYASKALATDITFSPELCNSYIAEAVFIRSLCYFYLVRTFRDVPYITEPYANDDLNFAYPKSEGGVILQKVVEDLETYVKKCKPGYEVEWQTKGRATCWAYYALMADIYLWQENYGKVLEKCSILERSGLALVPSKKYWEIFYPGNSRQESIFELQFRDGDGVLSGQKGELYNWFSADLTDARFIISESSKELFAQVPTEDIRGKEYMYDNRYIGEKYWKYAGTASRKGLNYPKDRLRGDREKSPNWIFYRYAEIVLMKAEAMTMTGIPYDKVCGMLDTTVRRRAGFKDDSKLVVPTGEFEMLRIILDERQKEFLAEGKQWFDVFRVARKGGYKYRSLLVQMLLTNVSAKDRPMWRIRLEDEDCHYLPLPKEDVQNSHGVLKQNPFYADME